jgi:hypothetical protein
MCPRISIRHLGRLEIDRGLADRLHRIGVKEGTRFMGHLGQPIDGKDGARLVVGPHHRRDRRARSERAPEGLYIETALRVDTDEVHFDPARLLQLTDEREDCRMLHARGDDLVTALLGQKRGENCRIVGLGAARGKNDLVVEGRSQQRL